MICRFTIYCHTNKVNGKRYVGQTLGTMEKRWVEHVAAARGGWGCRVLSAAIRKHGPESFDHEVLEIVVGVQNEADKAEAKWIEQQRCRSPRGYNLTAGGGALGHIHEDTKRLISAAMKKRMAEMTPEQLTAYLATNLHIWTPERRARQRERCKSKKVRENVRARQKEFWAKFTPEEKTRRVQHQLAGMSDEQKSARVRKVWAAMTPEAREARVRKATARSAATKSLSAHSKKMSEFQTAQARLRTPEQRREMVLKSWATRREKYGKNGVNRAKRSAEYSASAARGWANMTPEARVERTRKAREGRRQKREARDSRMVLINLLRAP
jgi:group I intron endonuclease